MDAAAPKVMFLRPVGRSGVDREFAAALRECKSPATEVHVASLPPEEGTFAHIEYRTYEAVVTRGIIRAVRAASLEGFGAFAIGCFYDTALHDAREISGLMPVTAPCQASCEIAAGVSNRFGIIVGRRKWVDQMAAVVRENGHGSRLAGFEPVELGVEDFLADRRETERRLLAAGRKLVEEKHAEAIILGCTRELGFHRKLSSELGVPVVDAAVAALKRAEHAAEIRSRCGWLPSRKWSCEPPPEQEFEAGCRNEAAEPFGNRIVLEAVG